MSDLNTPLQQPPQLVSTELRILGALMEKQLTTPDQYPLTLNSLIAACNQKSSRDPVSNHTQGEIARALQQLQHNRLVNKEFGSRAEKYSQQFIKHLELGRKHQALLCVMMLRGPQTLSELNTRTQRMVEFTDKDDLEHTLHRLCDREVPYAIRLSQQPGQRGERFTHLFSGRPTHSMPMSNENTETDTTVGATTNQNPGRVEPAGTPHPVNEVAEKSPDIDDLKNLRAELSALSEECNTLKRQIARLYQLTGHEPD
jgi:uncharacterized protein YceH (UPF0502 family)